MATKGSRNVPAKSTTPPPAATPTSTTTTTTSSSPGATSTASGSLSASGGVTGAGAAQDCGITLTIEKFAKRTETKVRSPVWNNEGLQWRLKVFPKGNDEEGWISAYVELANAGELPTPWSVECRWKITLVHNEDKSKSIENKFRYTFQHESDTLDWGFNKFVDFKVLQEDRNFFNKGGALTFKANLLSAVVTPPLIVKVKVFTEKDFFTHKLADLMDVDNKPISFSVSNNVSCTTLTARVSSFLNIGTKCFRLWRMVRRKNKTTRPHEVVMEKELLRVMAGELLLFAECCEAPPQPLPQYYAAFPPLPAILIFLKYYDPLFRRPCYVGSLYLDPLDSLKSTSPKLRQLVGLPTDADLTFYEEITPTNIEVLDANKNFKQAELVSGDVIVYQSKTLKTHKLASAYDWYMHANNHVTVKFVYDAEDSPPTATVDTALSFSLKMHIFASKARVLEKVAKKLGEINPESLLLRDKKKEKPLGRYETLQDMLLGADGKVIFFEVVGFTEVKLKTLMLQKAAIDEDLMCPACKKPHSTPMTHTCGALVCNSCLKEICPVCKVSITRDSIVRAPAVVERRLSAFHISCPICSMNISLRDLEVHRNECFIDCPSGCSLPVLVHNQSEHQSICAMSAVTCATCGVVVRRGHKITHHSRRCISPCANAGCSQNVVPNGQSKHDIDCAFKTVPCPQCGMPITTSMLNKKTPHCQLCTACGLMVEISSMARHASQLCAATEVPCDSADTMPCTWRGPRGKLQDHTRGCIYNGLKHVLSPVAAREAKAKAMLAAAEQENLALKARIAELQQRLSSL
ncbi:hypothetical protein Pelo_14174 [Pelomyxa schiedti]|nr:hypothetical protein Pelo_14174 [Pelomyxa schiedti]